MTDAELSALVAERVMGWKTVISKDQCFVRRSDDSEWERWQVASNIAAALEVVQTLLYRGYYLECVLNPAPKDMRVTVSRDDTLCECTASASTLQRAICVAALRAVGVEVEG